MKFIFLKLIWAYQYFISPWLGNHCRFIPTCSEYSKICFEKTHPLKALGMSAYRLCRCHPFSSGGVDWPIFPKLDMGCEVKNSLAPPARTPSDVER